MKVSIPAISFLIPWWFIAAWLTCGAGLGFLTCLAHPWNVYNPQRDVKTHGALSNAWYGFMKVRRSYRPVFVACWLVGWPALIKMMWRDWKRIGGDA